MGGSGGGGRLCLCGVNSGGGGVNSGGGLTVVGG